MAENILQKSHNFNIPVQRTDLSSFDDAFSSLKERFEAEMRRVDEEMTRFSTNLMYFYDQTPTGQLNISSQTALPSAVNPEMLTNSPLVEGEGDSKTLKLQFDVSQFTPNEVAVKILDNVLMVTAIHEEKTDSSTVYREYHREFFLPRGIDKEAIVSSLSRDGVLTIQTPMPPLLALIDRSAPKSTEVKK
ncbi:heat shock protein beta-6-like [Ostrinia nubilalis]|uniref:heat shock protein beta-6-like n=1 Tax=Ostrinia furnacalis TaxID=93504 RepID=UPI00103BAE2B|nr:heat shock protein beta-6-like [Ostrinia furnacalis]